ncbi:MAG: phage holin family protein [Methanoregula sp.]|nr:phage holin family protein [Methanoregula sp.]
MDEAAGTEEPSIESDFARTFKYIDLYIQQKTDLFLQHYVFEPVDFLIRRIMFLSVIVTLLAAGTLILLMGVILFIATLVPLWAALLITGIAVFGSGGVIAYMLLSDKMILNTPVATEMLKNGKP